MTYIAYESRQYVLGDNETITVDGRVYKQAGNDTCIVYIPANAKVDHQGNLTPEQLQSYGWKNQGYTPKAKEKEGD